MANTYLDHDIPEGRKKLIECNENLIGIAQYCEQNYAQSNDKREALGTTRVCFGLIFSKNFMVCLEFYDSKFGISGISSEHFGIFYAESSF